MNWAPNFGEDEPNIEGAVYQALGAASLCWEDMSGAGVFQSDEATRIAEGLLAFLRDHNADAVFWEARWREAADQREQMQVERDAARAEAERLRSPEWEAEVRADERERIVAELEGPARESEAMYAAVEADLAAARADVEFWKTQSQCNADMAAGFLAARDAAQAEVAALREEVAHAWAVANGGGPAMSARAVVERMMVGCEAASGNPWWCRVHESRIRFHVNPPTGGANDCDNFRDALDLAEEVQEKVLADLRAKAQGLPCRTWVPPHATDCPGRPGKRGICTCGDSLRASDWMLRADVLALIEEADRG